MYKRKYDIHAHVSHDTETIENGLTSKVLLGFVYDS